MINCYSHPLMLKAHLILKLKIDFLAFLDRFMDRFVAHFQEIVAVLMDLKVQVIVVQ